MKKKIDPEGLQKGEIDVKNLLKNQLFVSDGSFPVGTQYCGNIGFSLGFHCDVDRLRIEIEVTSLYDIFFQHHNDVVAITECKIRVSEIDFKVGGPMEY